MNQRNGKFIERLLANILDFQIIMSVILIPSLLPRFLTGQSLFGLNLFFYYFSVFMLSAPLGTLYSTIFISKFGGTLGKLLFGLRVENRDSNELIDKKRAFYRSTLGYIFSGQIFGLGFWRIIKNEENLAWHDELFFTKVLKYKKGTLGCIAMLVMLVLLGVLLFFFFQSIASAMAPPPTGNPIIPFN